MILDEARWAAAARAAAPNNKQQDPCETCQLGYPGHTHRPSWHGLPCGVCDCGGAFADVPEAWTTPRPDLHDDLEESA